VPSQWKLPPRGALAELMAAEREGVNPPFGGYQGERVASPGLAPPAPPPLIIPPPPWHEAGQKDQDEPPEEREP
jgi:hypothetical protein